MTTSTFRAAKTICDLSGWKVSNLPLQKLLYLSHMANLGRYGERLISGHFEAWDLGPVEPNLYRKVKAYGRESVVDIFPNDSFRASERQFDSIKLAFDKFGSAPPGMLVAITHRKGGAWADSYRPNVRGIIIPDKDIRLEYSRWFR